jgi:hypothetical protein
MPPQQVYNSPFIINNYNMSSNGDLRASFTSQGATDLAKVNESPAFNNLPKEEVPKKREL